MRVATYKERVATYKMRVATYKERVATYKERVATYKMRVATYKFAKAAKKMLFCCFWLYYAIEIVSIWDYRNPCFLRLCCTKLPFCTCLHRATFHRSIFGV